MEYIPLQKSVQFSKWIQKFDTYSVFKVLEQFSKSLLYHYGMKMDESGQSLTEIWAYFQTPLNSSHMTLSKELQI